MIFILKQPPQDAAVVSHQNVIALVEGEDHTTVDGRSTTKNQDMAKWARQTGTTVSSTVGEEKDNVDIEPESKIAFHHLKSLSLSYNNISTWKVIDELNKLPTLETLRVQHTPLNKTGGSVSILRQTFIARIRTLKSLNGGEVRMMERSDAEKLYIQRLLKAKLKEEDGSSTEMKTLSSFVDVLKEEHPRVQELLTLHGEPAVRKQGPGK